jgi:hypothetical protein
MTDSPGAKKTRAAPACPTAQPSHHRAARAPGSPKSVGPSWQSSHRGRASSLGRCACPARSRAPTSAPSSRPPTPVRAWISARMPSA